MVIGECAQSLDKEMKRRRILLVACLLLSLLSKNLTIIDHESPQNPS